MTATDIDRLHARLDATPDDHVLRMALADALEESDDPDQRAIAEGTRALGKWGRHPEQQNPPEWWWTWVNEAAWYKPDYQHFPWCLPYDWWQACRLVRNGTPGRFLCESRRAAEWCAAAGFARLPEFRRRELLGL